jgi:hypothetical protein
MLRRSAGVARVAPSAGGSPSFTRISETPPDSATPVARPDAIGYFVIMWRLAIASI